MNHLNSTLVEGVLVEAPKMELSPEGRAMCQFRIDSTHHIKNGEGYTEEVSRFDVITWDKQAKRCKKKLSKGKKIRAIGRLKQWKFLNAEGQQIPIIYIIAEHVEFKED